MSEYIERGKILEHKWLTSIGGNPYWIIPCKAFEEATVENVECIVKGELQFNDRGYLECSACHGELRMPLVSSSEIKRCYLCGAHMERSGSGE